MRAALAGCLLHARKGPWWTHTQPRGLVPPDPLLHGCSLGIPTPTSETGRRLRAGATAQELSGSGARDTGPGWRGGAGGGSGERKEREERNTGDGETVAEILRCKEMDGREEDVEAERKEDGEGEAEREQERSRNGPEGGPCSPFYHPDASPSQSGPHGLGTGWVGWPDIVLTLSQRNVSSSLAVGLSRSLPGPSQAHLQ